MLSHLQSQPQNRRQPTLPSVNISLASSTIIVQRHTEPLSLAPLPKPLVKHKKYRSLHLNERVQALHFRRKKTVTTAHSNGAVPPIATATTQSEKSA